MDTVGRTAMDADNEGQRKMFTLFTMADCSL